MAYATSTYMAIAAVAAVVSAGVTAYTAIESGNAAKEASQKDAAYKYQEAVKEQEKNASDAWREQLRHDAAEATQRVAFNVSGVASLPGDTVDLVTITTAGYNAMDEEAIRATGQARVDKIMNSANTALYTGEQTKTAYYRQAGTSILTGVTQAVGSYARSTAGTTASGQGGSGMAAAARKVS